MRGGHYCLISLDRVMQDFNHSEGVYITKITVPHEDIPLITRLSIEVVKKTTNLLFIVIFMIEIDNGF